MFVTSKVCNITPRPSRHNKATLSSTSSTSIATQGACISCQTFLNSIAFASTCAANISHILALTLSCIMNPCNCALYPHPSLVLHLYRMRLLLPNIDTSPLGMCFVVLVCACGATTGYPYIILPAQLAPGVSAF